MISNLSRRKFLNLAGTAIAGTSACSFPLDSLLADNIKRIKKGIQLYTVRDQMNVSVPSTLNKLAKIGYQEVEFAGYFGHSPKQIKALLIKNGLTSPSTHLSLDLIKNHLHQTLDDAAEVGHKFVVMPYLKDTERSLDNYKSYIEIFSRAGEAANSRGLRFGYHNHDFEFKSIDGIRPYDLLLNEINVDLMGMEMDVYWVIKAGVDPLDYINRYPNRFEQCHLKDMAADGRIVDLGQGVIDFTQLISTFKLAGVQHYYAENDTPADSLQSAQISLDYLTQLSL